jgi:hypothetical protein
MPSSEYQISFAGCKQDGYRALFCVKNDPHWRYVIDENSTPRLFATPILAEHAAGHALCRLLNSPEAA